MTSAPGAPPRGGASFGPSSTLVTEMAVLQAVPSQLCPLSGGDGTGSIATPTSRMSPEETAFVSMLSLEVEVLAVPLLQEEPGIDLLCQTKAVMSMVPLEVVMYSGV